MYRLILILMLSVFCYADAVAAETPEEKGLAIAMEAERRDSGFIDASSELLMILRNKQGEEATRQIHNQTLEVKDDGDKTLVVFDEPFDIKGTAFLSFTHKSGPDDQWLYLPARERVKRIVSSNKSGPFMGSEFAYEDIASQEVEKYAYRFVRDEFYEGMACFVVERDPVDPNSGYSYQKVWFDKQHYRPLRVEYYDRKRALLKTLTYSGYRQYLGKFWRASEFLMVNHQTGKSTRLIWKDYKFHNGFSDADFTPTGLKRAR